MPVDEQLLSELRALLPTSPSLTELSALEAEEVAELVQRRFVGEGDDIWWWDTLSSESVILPYGDSDGLEVLSKLIPGSKVVRLVVTDDEVRPWPVFEGEAKVLWSLLRELRFFEYFVTDRRCDWVVFDTHHNTLVIAGALLGTARSLHNVPAVGRDPL